MKKIKYHAEIRVRPLLGKELNTIYEKEGWEFITVIQSGNQYIHYFKRYD